MTRRGRSVTFLVAAGGLLLSVPSASVAARDIYRSPDGLVQPLRAQLGPQDVDVASPRVSRRNSTPTPVGTVSMRGNAVLLTLSPDHFIPAHLLDLQGTTLHFAPLGQGYVIQALPLAWDPSFGTEVRGFPSVAINLTNFQFPFSGQNWSLLHVNAYGSISFGTDQNTYYDPAANRFLLFQDYGGTLAASSVPIIAPLFRRLGGASGFAIDPEGVNHVYAKELSDRLVVTWFESEPYFDVLSFMTQPLVNRFQAVLHASGAVDFSYDRLFAQDGVVGVFAKGGGETTLVTLNDPVDAVLPGHIDVIGVTATLIGDSSIRFTFQTRGPVLPPGDPGVPSTLYRVFVVLNRPYPSGVDFTAVDLTWGIGGLPSAIYQAFGPGISPTVTVSGNTVSFTASVAALKGATDFAFFFDSVDFLNQSPDVFDQSDIAVVALPPGTGSELDLSVATGRGPARSVAYEAFHFADIPDLTQILCTVLPTVGDHFDLIAPFTDFRIDRQEAGAPSSGPVGNSVSGAATGGSESAAVCSQGRLHVSQFPSWIGAPMAGPSGRDFQGSFTGYDREVALLAHELGHGWLAVRKAKVNGQLVDISDRAPHWLPNLHSPSAFSVAKPAEASPMGGTNYQNNRDGTYTALDTGFFAPAKGYSYLDLYLMGLLPPEDVPPFFLLQDAAFVRYDGQGRAVYSGRPLSITVDDVIAANGVRTPPFATARKAFNLGLVGIVAPGQTPSAELLSRLQGVGENFSAFWGKATGGVSSVSVGAAVPCIAGADTLCLNSGRFRVQAQWKTSDGAAGIGRPVQLTSDTGHFWFFSSNNVEMVVKVVDGRAFNSRFWVFAGGLTNVNVVLTVTDTATGTVKTYTNPQGVAFQPIQDTNAFAPSATVEPNGKAAAVSEMQHLARVASWLQFQRPPSELPFSQSFRAQAPCVADVATLCLNGGRFSVQTRWTTPQGQSGAGQAVALTSDTGYFWFFSPSNVEMVVKAVTGCTLNSRYWVFGGGLTNINVEMTVTDTQTGEVKVYTNPQSTAFQPIQDTSAFACQ